MISHVLSGVSRNGKVSRILAGFLLAVVCPAQAQTFHWNPDPTFLAADGSGEAQKSYNWTSNTNGTGSWPKSAFDDDFSAGTLGPAWTFLDSTHDSGTQSVTSSPGVLTLTAAGKGIWTFESEYSAVYRSDITGDFDVSVQVTSLSGVDPWTKTGILVFNNFKKGSSGGAFAVMVTQGNGFAVHYDSGDVGRFDSPSGSTGATAFVPCWLRAVKKGGVFSGYYKTSITNPWTLIEGPGSSQLTAAVGNS